MHETLRKKDPLWNLPPRLSALKTYQNSSQGNNKFQTLRVQASKTEQVEEREHPKSDHQKVNHVLEREQEIVVSPHRMCFIADV